MEAITDALVAAGYFRARISTLSDFDKIIGGIAWAMQVFSYDLNINIFYADSLDLGQKISLTERLVMVLVVIDCPHRIEPHQIVGLDYANLLPVVKWLIKRSAEVRQEQEAFNRLLALRHFHRVTNSLPDRSSWCHMVPIAHLKKLRRSCLADQATSEGSPTKADTKVLPKAVAETSDLIKKLDEEFKDNKHISFTKLASLFRGTNRGLADQRVDEDEEDADLGEDAAIDDELADNIQDDIEEKPKASSDGDHDHKRLMSIASDSSKSKELDNELLATNQKILNLLKKLDSMPSETEISQYQKRYIELHQQLISKNKDLKKLYALFNSLESTKHYLTKEINLLDSIASNLDLTEDSPANREDFLRQFREIIAKIQQVKDEVITRRDVMRRKSAKLNEEYAALVG